MRNDVNFVEADLFVASPVEDYFELCHGEDSSLSAEEQHLTKLTTRKLLSSCHLHMSVQMTLHACQIAFRGSFAEPILP